MATFRKNFAYVLLKSHAVIETWTNERSGPLDTFTVVTLMKKKLNFSANVWVVTLVGNH